MAVDNNLTKVLRPVDAKSTVGSISSNLERISSSGGRLDDDILILLLPYQLTNQPTK